MNLPSVPTDSKRIPPVAEGDYGNFQQPGRLVWRMLTSGDRAAVAALFREGMKVVARPIDWSLTRTESRYLCQKVTSNRPIVLVVGAPRSGTTLIYQTLARCCEVSYFTNWTALFPRSPIAATRLFMSQFGSRQTNFRSFYGQTATFSDPNDGFSIWNRWLGDDRYSTPTELSATQLHEMRQFLNAWTTTFGLPLLNKNNRNTSCIALLARAIPQAQFVVVRRNQRYVAQSLIHARKNIQGDKRAGWGLQSRSARASQDPLGYVDDICDQLLDIESDLQSQLNQVDSTRIHTIEYETFCRHPALFLEGLRSAIPEIQLREKVIQQQLSPFQISTSQSVTDEELQRIHARLRTEHSR